MRETALSALVVAIIGSCDSLTKLGMKLNRSVRALLLAACWIGLGGERFAAAADKTDTADKISLPGDKAQGIQIKERGFEIPSLFDKPLSTPSSRPLFRMPGSDRPTIDPKTQRRMQDQQYEKENWMFLGRGELKERRERIESEGVLGDKWEDRKSTRLNSSHIQKSRMPSSA